MRSLVTQHEPQIRAFLNNRSGPHVLSWTTVDDLFQETVAAAIAAAQAFTYCGDGAFLSWIRVVASRIVSRSVSDRQRKMFQGPTPATANPPDTDATEIVPDDGPGPSTLYTQSERAQAVRTAIDRLTERYRKVLTRYKLEERSLAEVAAELGLTKGATARLIDRALRQLRTQLEEI